MFNEVESKKILALPLPSQPCQICTIGGLQEVVSIRNMVIYEQDTKSNMVIAAGVEITKAEATRYGVELAYRLGFRDIILECDAISVINAISSNSAGSTPIFLVYNDILRLKTQFDNFACKHVKRSRNAVAHLIARWDIYGCNEY
ncbi:Glucose-1-phosphate adenylyltransferase, partial [Bienertia sinuspersici]